MKVEESWFFSEEAKELRRQRRLEYLKIDWAAKVAKIVMTTREWISQSDLDEEVKDDLRTKLDRAVSNFRNHSHRDNHDMNYPYLLRFVQLEIVDVIEGISPDPKTHRPGLRTKDNKVIALTVEGKTLREVMHGWT